LAHWKFFEFSLLSVTFSPVSVILFCREREIFCHERRFYDAIPMIPEANLTSNSLQKSARFKKL
jgi:hypothetical protein